MTSHSRLLFCFLTLLYCVIFLPMVRAQGRPGQPKITWPAFTEPKLVLVSTDGTVTYLRLGPGLYIDRTTNTLNITPSNYTLTRFIYPWMVPTDCAMVGVYRNGVLQSPFPTSMANPDYVLGPPNYVYLYVLPDKQFQVFWMADSIPLPTDTVTIQCQRILP